MGIPLNGPNSHQDRVFVFAESSEDCLGEGGGGGAWRARNGGRTGLRGLPAASARQVKWADNEKAAEKLILVRRDAALIRASGRKSRGFAVGPATLQFASASLDSVRGD